MREGPCKTLQGAEGRPPDPPWSPLTWSPLIWGGRPPETSLCRQAAGRGRTRHPTPTTADTHRVIRRAVLPARSPRPSVTLEPAARGASLSSKQSHARAVTRRGLGSPMAGDRRRGLARRIRKAGVKGCSLLFQPCQHLSGLVLAEETGGRHGRDGQRLPGGVTVSHLHGRHPQMVLDLRIVRELGGTVPQ